MNQCILIGHAGQDPEIKHFASTDRKVATFTLATTEKFGDKETTTWHNIVAWGYLADRPVQKGDKIMVSGRIENRKWEKDGNTYYRTEIVATQLEICKRFTKVPTPDFRPEHDPFRKAKDEDGFTLPNPPKQSRAEMGTGSDPIPSASTLLGIQDDLPF